MVKKSKNKVSETELITGIRTTKVTESSNDIHDDDNDDHKETDTLLPAKPLVLSPEERKLLHSTLSDDFFAIIDDVKYFAPISAILFALLGLYLALDPFTIYPKRPVPMSHEEYVSLKNIFS